MRFFNDKILNLNLTLKRPISYYKRLSYLDLWLDE